MRVAILAALVLAFGPAAPTVLKADPGGSCTGSAVPASNRTGLPDRCLPR